MVTLNVSTEKQLSRFLGKYADNRLKIELLAFWCRHPNAKFARSAIYCASDWDKLDMDRALQDMVEMGLVDTQAHNSLRLYWLTTNEERRRPVMELASLGWARWQLMVKRIAEPNIAAI